MKVRCEWITCKHNTMNDNYNRFGKPGVLGLGYCQNPKEEIILSADV